MKYYNFIRNWTRSIVRHLDDQEFQTLMIHDMNKLTIGRWASEFKPGMTPSEWETCDWQGRPARYHAYVKHAACHYVVNFNLRLARLVQPKRPWIIVSGELHSTVWDQGEMLFDMNFSALGMSAADALALARYNAVPVPFGKYIWIGFDRPAFLSCSEGKFRDDMKKRFAADIGKLIQQGVPHRVEHMADHLPMWGRR